jgi:hypothetical protein
MVAAVALLALVALVAVARPNPVVTEPAPVEPVVIIQRADGTPITVLNTD